jgi:hypothetical protein
MTMNVIFSASTTSPSSTLVSVATVLGVVGVVAAIAQRIWWRRKYGEPEE